MGQQLKMTAKSTKMAAYRLRQLVRAEVSESLEDGSEIDDMLLYLFG